MHSLPENFLRVASAGRVLVVNDRIAMVCAILGMMTGCGHGPGKISDADLADKIPAIARAASQHDQSTIPVLIDNLDSDDPAVRFYAIEGLHSLTGQDNGYVYYEDDAQRKPAVERWRRWLASRPFFSRQAN